MLATEHHIGISRDGHDERKVVYTHIHTEVNVFLVIDCHCHWLVRVLVSKERSYCIIFFFCDFEVSHNVGIICSFCAGEKAVCLVIFIQVRRKEAQRERK